MIAKKVLCKVAIVLRGVKEQHFCLCPDHFELFNASNLRVISFLILEVLLLRLNLALFLEGNDILIKRANMLLLVPDLRILGPRVDGLVVLRWRDDVSIERVVEFEVEEGKEKDGVLFELDGFELVGVEVVANAVEQGDNVEVLTQGFPILRAIFAAEFDVLSSVLPLRKNGVQGFRVEASALRKEGLHFPQKLLVEESDELGMERLKGFSVALSRGKTESKHLIFNVLQLLAQDLEAILYNFLEVRPEGKAFLLLQLLQEILRQGLHLSANRVIL